MLFNKNILYSPDYVINAGGLINIYNELGVYNRESVFNHIFGAKVFEGRM